MRMIRTATLAAALLTIAATAQAEDGMADRFEEHEYTYTGGPYEEHAFPYRLLKPETVEEGEKYPVVLFLHGAGERGNDNAAQLKFLPTWMAEPGMREEYPCFLIAPQCPTERTWGSVNWSAEEYRYADEPAAEMRAVMGMLEYVLENYPVDEDRVYLTGLSMGGFGSWELAARRPEWFAAVVPICGGGDMSRVEPLVGLPLWAWHGDADRAVPVGRSREMIEALKEAGGEPKYTELPGVGHDSWTPAYTREDGVVPWMFEQKRAR